MTTNDKKLLGSFLLSIGGLASLVALFSPERSAHPLEDPESLPKNFDLPESKKELRKLIENINRVRVITKNIEESRRNRGAGFSARLIKKDMELIKIRDAAERKLRS